jgi:hypothetical protein
VIDRLAQQVAKKYASYFSVGTIVLFGKYKNKRGKILSFGKDKWGNPTIVVEPIPKGRKQNKTLGLYKIWRADVKEKALEKMDKLTVRVVNAYHRKEALDVGRSWENEKWRIHRYRGPIFIWDLTNAGKRGKKVKKLVVNEYGSGGRVSPMESLAMEFILHAKRDVSYERMKQVAEESGQNFSEGEERGVDVSPGGFAPLEIRGEHVLVQVGWKDFMVRNIDDKYNEETCIPAIKGGVRAIPAFYRWVQDNKAKIEKMIFSDVLKAMRELDVPYHQYCAMD